MSIAWRKLRDELSADLTTYSAESKISCVLAVSGGVDSIFLLDFMRTIPEFRNVTVAHFNHLPSQMMDRCAEETVRKYCSKLGIESQLVVGYGDEGALRKAPSFEAAARRARYKWLLNCAIKHSNKNSEVRIITAHNQSDQVENVLLGLCRGTPINRIAMARLTYFEPTNGVRPSIYRPLIGIPKDELVRQAKRRGLEGLWTDDETNLDTKYERNFMRHAVIPLLKTRRNVSKTIPKSVPTEECIYVRGNLFSAA